MKLRNKKTGEIGELQITEKHCAVSVGNGTASCGIEIYSSLAELNAEWEDYKSDKERWYINENGGVLKYIPVDPNGEDLTYMGYQKEIGNYFETKEEAEKAVEKLKAWKRLKDKGFRFIEGWLDNNDDFIIKAKLGTVGLIDQPDVHLLFGGEE